MTDGFWVYIYPHKRLDNHTQIRVTESTRISLGAVTRMFDEAGDFNSPWITASRYGQSKTRSWHQLKFSESL
jgi:hypothetical protein